MVNAIVTLENLLPDDDQDVIIRKTRTTPKTKHDLTQTACAADTDGVV